MQLRLASNEQSPPLPATFSCDYRHVSPYSVEIQGSSYLRELNAILQKLQEQLLHVSKFGKLKNWASFLLLIYPKILRKNVR